MTALPLFVSKSRRSGVFQQPFSAPYFSFRSRSKDKEKGMIFKRYQVDFRSFRQDSVGEDVLFGKMDLLKLGFAFESIQENAFKSKRRENCFSRLLSCFIANRGICLALCWRSYYRDLCRLFWQHRSLNCRLGL